MKIHKYQIPTSPASIEMPLGATIKAVHSQNENIFLWVEVDEKQFTTELRLFRTYYTSREIMAGGWYIGTVFVQGGAIVYHVYEYPNK